MNFKIETDVPVPPIFARYPFAQMQLGDSFVMPQEQVSKARNAASAFARKRGVKFLFRRVDNDTFRCWRIK